MFERPKSGERAVLVHLAAQDETEALVELQELALSAGAEPVAVVIGKRQAPDPRYYIGKGKLDELARIVRENEVELVLFNHPLTPSQERNLEKEISVRVIDRTGLILDIFAQRAQSFEGKLQVELAQLRHLSTRLVRGWTHLERQKGGIGLRGPGETQLETDKRLIANRIRQIQKRLEKVEQQRSQGRTARRRAELPVVGLVGYTNAGKSTLFNALTGAGVYAANQLFATLDPTLRRLQLAPNSTVILADTVGFIRHLPHELVAAFRSTLKEAAEADLLLHVIDASDERADETVCEVNRVLGEIGADRVRQIQVFNKIDRIADTEPHIEKDESGDVGKVWLSAKTGAGLPLLQQALEALFRGEVIHRRVHLAPANAGLRARLYGTARILREESDDTGGWDMEIELHKKDARLLHELDEIEASISA
ncbi:ribosome rescue GTPase HflX [Methylocaldum sp. MU1018]